MKQDELALSDYVAKRLQDYFNAHEMGLPTAGLYDRVMREVERPLLAIALNACRHNQLRAAALLGINRNTLRKKMIDCGLIEKPLRKKARVSLLSKRGRG